MSISQKLVAAIAVPLLIQISFMATYHVLLMETEKLAASESRAKEMIGHLNWIVSLAALSMSFSDRKDGSQELIYAKTYKQVREQVPAELEALDKLVFHNESDKRSTNNAGEAAIRKAEEEAVKNFSDAVTVLVTYSDAAVTETPTDDASTEAIKSAWQNLFVARSKLLKLERDESKRATALIPQVRQQLALLINIGAAVDVLIAAAILYYLGTNISKRLAVVAENSAQFAKGKQLAEPIGGNDELAQLDESFHSMAKTVREVERAKQEFVAMLSHDLRTPLSNVLITLDLLLSVPNSSASKAEKQRIEAAMESLEQVLTLVTALLHMEKFEAGLMNIDAQDEWTNKVVQSAMSNVGEVAERNQVSVVYTTETDYLLRVDADKIVRVLVNLISNAIKFSPPKSTITISTDPHPDSVTFRVKDQGRGIPKSEQAQVFDRYKQVLKSDENKESGTGLGLAICKAIVESHGGTIGVESEEGQGACFWFTVPVAQKRATPDRITIATAEFKRPDISKVLDQTNS